MATAVESMYEFINSAERSRKYPPNTAGAYRSALRLFDSELTEDERESVDLLKDRLDQIYRLVVSKNNQKMTSGSLETYRRRFSSMLKDYEIYGVDPTKMASWNRKVRKFKNGKVSQKIETIINDDNEDLPKNRAEMNRLELSLRPSVKAIIVIPPDITNQEAAMIKAIIDAHVIQTIG